MMQVVRNMAASRAACPILDDEQIEAYISRGDVPTGAAYLEVPPTKIVRQRGFWLRPNHRMHHTAALFLISTDVYAMNDDAHADRRDQIYCYRSSDADTAYLGRVELDERGRRTLTPLMYGLHDPFEVEAAGLTYVGRVISAL